MKSKKLSFCALMAALATVIMMAAWFPYITYAVPCVASLAVMVVTIELGKKWAFTTYIVSLFPVMLFCESESKLLYLCFMGFYPVLKAVLEQINIRALEYALKLVCFNLCVLILYLISSYVFDVTYDDLGELGKYGTVIFLVLANVTFVAYDFCITKMSEFYMIRFHKNVEKILRKK